MLTADWSYSWWFVGYFFPWNGFSTGKVIKMPFVLDLLDYFQVEVSDYILNMYFLYLFWRKSMLEKVILISTLYVCPSLNQKNKLDIRFTISTCFLVRWKVIQNNVGISFCNTNLLFYKKAWNEIMSERDIVSTTWIFDKRLEKRNMLKMFLEFEHAFCKNKIIVLVKILKM